MTDTLKVGDVVRLKSGGPNMTIREVGDVYGKLTVWCSWFAGKEFRQESFPAEAVELVSA